MNDLGPMVGRDAELATLGSAFVRDGSGFRRVVLVSGPAGRGKSRLVAEALTALQQRQPGIPVVCLGSGHQFRARAMQQLRWGPLVVLVDDAHSDPSALAPLLAFVRERLDVQLVLAARPSARSAVIEQTLLAQFSLSEVEVVDLGTLPTKQARQLVKALIGKLELSFALKSYLAVQAEHSPHVAVVTVNLIRRGELTGVLAADDGWRSQVLARYRDLLVANVEGLGIDAVHRVVATYAALGSVQAADPGLVGRIATFCGMKVVDLARVLRALRDRGVLVEHAGLLRVVPDVLADHVLEGAAAFEEYDTGFVADIWQAFGGDHHHRLALSLGELDWRLAQRGGPGVMAGVWAAIRCRLMTPYYGRVINELSQMEQLAATQPAAVVSTLEDLRRRLDRDDRDGVEAPEDNEDHPYRKAFGLTPLGRADVRAKMPSLYARAAVNDSEQLETVLDALWALRRCDAGPARSNPGHADRMISDRLADLATLPHASFPQRIVARVTEWLTEPGEAGDAATPLFALRSLLAKEGVETVQANIRQLEFRTHTIDAARVREVRDQIRELLQLQGISADLRRAGEAIDLLHEALRQPHGYFNQTVSDDVILQWEDDDLATLGAFSHVADHTTSAVVRRRIREHTAWSAEHAKSLRVQHAALTLIAQLDTTTDLADDVADHLLKAHFTAKSFTVWAVPTLEELAAQRSADQERSAGMSEEERQADQDARLHDKVQQRMALHDENLADTARKLLALDDIPTMQELLDQTARAVVTVKSGHWINMWGLWRTIAEQAPEYLEAIVQGIAGLPPGPLDQQLALLITPWIDYAQLDAGTWVKDSTASARREVKLAIASGFSAQRWYHVGAPFVEAWTIGISDPDPDIAQAFLAAAGTYLSEQPVAAVETLLQHNISQPGAARAIEDACNYDGKSYGAALNLENAIAILRLISHAGYDSHAVQETLTGIATRHPQLVLDHLTNQVDNAVTRLDIHELSSAYDVHTDVLIAFIRNNISTPTLGLVTAAVLNVRLTDNQTAALGELAGDLDGGDLRSLVDLLAHIDQWPLHQPVLAHTVTGRARATGVHSEMRPRIQQAMRPSHWGTASGVSEELNAALARAAHAGTQATDAELKDDYESAEAYIQSMINRERRKAEEDDNARW